MPTQFSCRADHFRHELAAFGVQKPVILSESTGVEAMPYLDLMPEGRAGQDVFPQAVAENHGRPLLYVVDNTSLSNSPVDREQQLRKLRRSLGSRGERSYLGILEPGQLTVLPISLSANIPQAVHYQAGTGSALTFFSRLALGQYEGPGDTSTPDYVYEEMFGLLKHVADELADGHGLEGGEVLSLVGRALFFRFLCDRNIVKAGSLRSIAPAATSLTACFANEGNASATCAWLDATFNGDFLPLIPDGIRNNNRASRESSYARYFRGLKDPVRQAVTHHLSAILYGHQPNGPNYQTVLHADWARFDFAHVPVGLLSQVYEAFSWRWTGDAKGTSVHYTPRGIADYLVEEAFHSLPNAATARVLDPACGAGVFLVLAFRKLYNERWKAAGGGSEVRPDTKVIRDILENQITGFDVSENALRLASLSLYLTAIELDPLPAPPSKLRFKNLRERVLLNCRLNTEPQEGPVMGSLSHHVPPEHNSAYDLVLCNPPWTSLETKHKKITDEMDLLSREIIARRWESHGISYVYQNPDKVPDLPFVWKATEWCRPMGRIGMVLHGRNLFKQEPVPTRARETLFRSLCINGILNCSNLSDTKVWPGMNQPFFLLFACNEIPGPDHCLRWVTPHCELNLNSRGEIRVDSESVHLINVQSTLSEPWLWKTLAVGTALDVDIIRKIKAVKGRTLLEYWVKDMGLRTGNGYQVKPEQPEQIDAGFLHTLPDLKSSKHHVFEVNYDMLEPVKTATMCFPRERDLYRAPLVLIRESPRPDRRKGRALLAKKDVAFSQSFHGYSAYEHPDATLLNAYLHLFAHSEVWLHYALCTSSSFGAERRRINKSDFDDCIIVPISNLRGNDCTSILRLSERLLSEDESVFSDIDSFFAGLYGLTLADTEVIRETLENALPYNNVREHACAGVSPAVQEDFAARLSKILRPFVQKHGAQVHVEPWSTTLTEEPFTYRLLLVGTAVRPMQVPDKLFREQVLSLANETGASRVIIEVNGGLVLGVLNQHRYWTLSRARLCAAEIINRHMNAFQ